MSAQIVDRVNHKSALFECLRFVMVPLRMFMKVYGQLIFAFGVTQTILTAAADAH
jgi:hypothetical protein